MKIRLTILSLFWAIIAFSQNPSVNGPGINPAPAVVGEQVTFQVNLQNTSTAVPLAPMSPMKLNFSANKWKPLFEEDGVTPIVYSDNGTHEYFTWTVICSNCDVVDETWKETWNVIGTQNQTFPANPGPFGDQVFGYIYLDGVATGEATIEEANNNNNGVGFNFNIVPRAGFNLFDTDDDASTYTHTVPGEQPCTMPPAEGTPANTYVGITTLERNTQNWLASAPDNQLGSYIALESTNKGLVITRMPDPETVIANPVEGMVVWDTTEHCLKLYKGIEEGWSCTSNACN